MSILHHVHLLLTISDSHLPIFTKFGEVTDADKAVNRQRFVW